MNLKSHSTDAWGIPELVAGLFVGAVLMFFSIWSIVSGKPYAKHEEKEQIPKPVTILECDIVDDPRFHGNPFEIWDFLRKEYPKLPQEQVSHGYDVFWGHLSHGKPVQFAYEEAKKEIVKCIDDTE